jgi:hypothetical protein
LKQRCGLEGVNILNCYQTSDWSSSSLHCKVVANSTIRQPPVVGVTYRVIADNEMQVHITALHACK